MGVLSQYCSNSGKLYCNLIQRVLRYVARILNRRLILCKNFEDNIVGYLDLDYVELIDGRKLTGAYIFIFIGESISHSSKL